MNTPVAYPNSHGRTLTLNYSGRIIDHLGIQMYQSPVAAIAELVANAWDADATRVSISLPSSITSSAEVVIRDDGIGMKFNECQDRFLNVGRARRGSAGTERSPSKRRRILGRKGIGKFAGFGIAEVIQVETVSQENGERTVFEMDINKIRTDDYVSFNGTEITVVDYDGPDDDRQNRHGTTIRLKQLQLQRTRTPEAFARSMARRFLLHQSAADFQILVNNRSLPEADDLFPVQFRFPGEYQDNECPDGLQTSGEWGIESVGNRKINWRVRFYEDPIGDDELRGISVFAGGKMVQAPFFFNLSGSLPGQHGQQYISGQIQADFLDEQDDDLTAPERQRVNWDHPAATELQEWGRGRLRQLLGIWRDRRGEKRQQQLEERLSGFSNRLARLPNHERQTVSRAVRRVAQIETLSQSQFEELGDAMVVAWEQGRLRDLINDISDTEDLRADQLVEILAEAEVLTALNIAEAVKTKLQAVGGLKQRIEKKELENDVRDYISEHPWIVSPKWETFAKETGVRTLMERAAHESGIANHADSRGRIDLALSSGDHLLILEFMRPGLTINLDHINRFDDYVRIMRAGVASNTGGRFNRITGYLVADNLHRRANVLSRLESLSRDDMFALDWSTLFEEAKAQWQEFLDILAGRDPQDERLRVLLGDRTD